MSRGGFAEVEFVKNVMNNKLKICIYSPQFHPSLGGLQNVVQYYANGLHNLGHQVVVITNENYDGIEPFKFSVRRNIGFRKEYEVIKKSDLVIMNNVSLKALPQVILAGKPLFVIHHSGLKYDDEALSLNAKMKQLVANNYAKHNIACSRYIAKLYKNCTVIKNPYNSDVFYNKSLQRKKNSVVFVGRFVTDKGIDLLLNAAAILKLRSVSFSVTIIGKGPEEDGLKKLSDGLGLGDIINWTGPQTSTEIAGILNTHEVMIVPSRFEPYGIVALEGLASGCKVIISSQGGLKEAAGGYATVFENENHKDLADVIEACLLQKNNEFNYSLQQYLSGLSIEETVKKLELVMYTYLK